MHTKVLLTPLSPWFALVPRNWPEASWPLRYEMHHMQDFSSSSTRVSNANYVGSLWLNTFLVHWCHAAHIVPPTSNTQSTVIHTVSAASAGAIATMVTHPFDVIKV